MLICSGSKPEGLGASSQTSHVQRLGEDPQALTLRADPRCLWDLKVLECDIMVRKLAEA
jgi:hypothetical protein